MVSLLHDIVGSEGNELAGKRIAMGITGSVSAYRAPDIARLLMRHGANVFAVMSDKAQQIIHPTLMEWATGNHVVTELTGKIEHVTLTAGPTKSDLILIAPCTANTISKIACGIDDTSVTSCVSSALGGQIPIVIAPAMHQTMYQQPLVMENVRKLTELGVVFVQPEEAEEKAKLASPEAILTCILQIFTPKDLEGKKVLITTGPTFEHIDPIRVITNPSSGKMGSTIAFEAHRRGATLTIIHGPTSSPLPRETKKIQVRTTKEMYDATLSELQNAKYDLVIATAAAADYAPITEQKKIPTDEHPKLVLELQPTPKIIDEIKKRSPQTFLVAFRAQAKLSPDELVSDGYERLKKAHADLIAVNDVGRNDIGFGSDYNELILIDSHAQSIMLKRASKRIIAKQLLDEVSKRLGT